MHEHVVHRRLEAAVLDAQPGRGVALRIEVDDQRPLAELGQAGTEVDRGGRLADAALLVGDGDHAGERASRPLDRLDVIRRRIIGRRDGRHRVVRRLRGDGRRPATDRASGATRTPVAPRRRPPDQPVSDGRGVTASSSDTLIDVRLTAARRSGGMRSPPRPMFHVEHPTDGARKVPRETFRRRLLRGTPLQHHHPGVAVVDAAEAAGGQQLVAPAAPSRSAAR